MTQSQGGGGGGGATSAIAIIAIVGLVLFFGWYFITRDSGAPQQAAPQSQPAPQAQPPADDSDVDIKVDLPDTVQINP